MKVFRDSEIIKWTRTARDFSPNSRRPVRRILDVFVGRDNEEFGQKDKQDGSFYFFRVPYMFDFDFDVAGKNRKENWTRIDKQKNESRIIERAKSKLLGGSVQ